MNQNISLDSLNSISVTLRQEHFLADSPQPSHHLEQQQDDPFIFCNNICIDGIQNLKANSSLYSIEKNSFNIFPSFYQIEYSNNKNQRPIISAIDLNTILAEQDDNCCKDNEKVGKGNANQKVKLERGQAQRRRKLWHAGSGIRPNNNTKFVHIKTCLQLDRRLKKENQWVSSIKCDAILKNHFLKNKIKLCKMIPIISQPNILSGICLKNGCEQIVLKINQSECDRKIRFCIQDQEGILGSQIDVFIKFYDAK